MAEAEPKRDPGLFAIMVRVRKPEDLPVVAGADRRGPGRGGHGHDRSGSTERDQVALRYAFAGSLRRPTPSLMRLAPRSRLTRTGPEAINELFAAYDRLTPADLQARGPAKYFQLANETAIILETEIKK